MKIYHFNSTQGSHWFFRRNTEKRKWEIFTGNHNWIVQFACRCDACRVHRIAKFTAWLTNSSVEEVLQILERNTKYREAITQLRFREAQKNGPAD